MKLSLFEKGLRPTLSDKNLIFVAKRLLNMDCYVPVSPNICSQTLIIELGQWSCLQTLTTSLNTHTNSKAQQHQEAATMWGTTLIKLENIHRCFTGKRLVQILAGTSK